MKKPLLIAALLMGAYFTTNAQTVVWSDNFDDLNADGWNLVDVDDDGNNFSVVQVTGDGGAPVGTPLLRSASWIGTPAPNGTNLTPDNWAISPAINLGGASGTTTLTWEAIASDADWDDEEYTVYVSTGNNQAAFEASTVTFNETLIGVNSLTARSLDVSDFAGQTIYVAFRHHNTEGQFTMGIDNVAVSTQALGIDSPISTQFSVSPNPATNIINISNAQNMLVTGISIVDINGRTVKSAGFNNVAQAQINISDLASGVYMMNITSDHGTATKKIVKN